MVALLTKPELLELGEYTPLCVEEGTTLSSIADGMERLEWEGGGTEDVWLGLAAP